MDLIYVKWLISKLFCVVFFPVSYAKNDLWEGTVYVTLIKLYRTYRLITVSSSQYKMFMVQIKPMIMSTLDKNWPYEQAVFQKYYSIMNHLHMVNQILEKTRE